MDIFGEEFLKILYSCCSISLGLLAVVFLVLKWWHDSREDYDD